MSESALDPRGGRSLQSIGLAAGLLAVATAAFVRIASLDAKPFWRDEAWVAWLIELPDPQRVAVQYVLPAGFLAVEKALAGLLPGFAPEIAYRLLSLACGLGAVVLLPVLARRAGASPPVALAALWLATGMPALVYYARELKPYAIELLWSVLVPLVALDLATPAAPLSRRGAALRWLLLLTLAAAAPWLAYGAVFPVVAALGWLGWRQLGAGRERGLLVLLIVLVLLASLGMVYHLFLRDQLSSRVMREMWDLAPPAWPSPGQVPRALLAVHWTSLTYLFGRLAPLAIPMILIGIVIWPAEGRVALLWAWLGAGTAAAAASLVNVWVLDHGRFLLFVAPPLILFAAAGLVGLGEWMGRRILRRGAPSSIGVALAASAGLTWSANALVHRWRPPSSDPRLYFVFDVLQDIEPLIARLEAAQVPPSLVMVSRYAGDGFRYYRRGRLAGAHVSTMVDRDRGRALDDWLVLVRDEGWLILVDEEAGGGMRGALEERAFRVEEATRERGARLWRVARDPRASAILLTARTETRRAPSVLDR